MIWVREFSTCLCRCSCCLGAWSAVDSSVGMKGGSQGAFSVFWVHKMGSCPSKNALLSRATIQKGTKEQEQTQILSVHLKKKASASFTFAEAPLPPSPKCIVWQAAGLGGPSTVGCGAWCWPCLHILCCPFKSRISSSEQRHCGCLELLPVFQLDIKSLKPAVFPFKCSSQLA